MTSCGQVTLLYSAATRAELLFRESIDEVCSRREKVRARYFVTREEAGAAGGGGAGDGETWGRRMERRDLEQCLQTAEDKARTLCYVCGPPGMVETVKSWLEELSISPQNIKYELWW